ncbi:hypothetical protein EV1_007709 [Malus domestica]
MKLSTFLVVGHSLLLLKYDLKWSHPSAKFSLIVFYVMALAVVTVPLARLLICGGNGMLDWAMGFILYRFRQLCEVYCCLKLAEEWCTLLALEIQLKMKLWLKNLY